MSNGNYSSSQKQWFRVENKMLKMSEKMAIEEALYLTPNFAA